MSAKAKAQLAGQTVVMIGGSSRIGLETALPFCLYSPKYVEEKFCELRLNGVQRSSHSLGPTPMSVRGPDWLSSGNI